MSKINAKEMRNLKKSLSIIAKELWKIQKAGDREYVFTKGINDGSEHIHISIKNNLISFTKYNYGLADITLKSNVGGNISIKSDLSKTSNLNLISDVITNYADIKKSLVRIVTHDCERKNSAVEKAVSFNQKYAKEAVVKLDLPPSITKYQLEVSNEDGKNIGVINCGDMTIKFITEGDIKFVDNRNPKDKTLVKK